MISIIGAGPAGSYTAYLLAKKNQEVTVYEADKKIGDPIQCSGVVTPEIEKILKINKEVIVNKIKKVKFISPDNNSFEVNIPNDYVYNRAELDRFIASLAEKEGVKFNLNHRFVNYEKKENKLKLKFENSYQETDILIGADGPYSKVAQSAGLFNNRKFITGIQARCKFNSEDKSKVQIYLGYGEFGWVIPEDEYTARIGVVSEKNPQNDFHKLIKNLNAEIINYQSGMIPLYDPKIKTQKENVYLIGDAATMVKASTHGSILYCLLTAQNLADAITEKKDYEKLWRKNIGFDLWLNLKIRNTLCKFSEKDYNKLVEYFSQEKLKNILSSHVRDFPSRFVLKLLFKEPRLLRFSGKLIHL